MLNTDIAMSFRMPEIEGPLDQYSKVLTLKNMIEQDKMQKMQMDEAHRKSQRAAEYRSRVVAAGTDPEKLRAVAIEYGDPKDVLRYGIPKPAENLFDKPKISDYTPESIRLYSTTKNPADLIRAPKEASPETSPEIVKLGNLLQTLPPEHPMRKSLQARIDVLSSRVPAVQVNMPASSDLMQRPDGTYVRVRVGKDGKVEETPLGNVRPPATAAQMRDEREANEDASTMQSVRQRIGRMANLVQGGAMAGGVVGPMGIASRLGETVAGAVSNVPTPAIDFKNEQSLLLSDVRKMVEKDPNLSRDERERLYETLGGGLLQTPGSSIRTLNNVLSYIEGKKLTGKKVDRGTADKKPPAIGQIVQGYRFIGGDPSIPAGMEGSGWEKVP